METSDEPRVVVGVSGSLANLSALHTAVDYARGLGAEVIAVRAWLPVGGEIAYRRGPCPPLLELWRERAFDSLATAFADAFGGLPPDLTVRRATGRGETGPVLVAVADGPGIYWLSAAVGKARSPAGDPDRSVATASGTRAARSSSFRNQR